MEQNFTIQKLVGEDSNGVLINENHQYKAELSGDTAHIYQVNDSDTILLVIQPWKTNSDGTRSEWNTIEEVIQWYQQQF